ALVQGLPAGLEIDLGFINAELRRRQGGYGRGGRQRIERDEVEVLSGVRRGRTMGSPLALLVRNRDSRLDDLERTPPLHRPRPGHADLAGSVKFLTTDCRDVLERASARETAARVCAGALAQLLLRVFGVEVFSFVRSIHQAQWDGEVAPSQLAELRAARDASDVYCPDEQASAQMIEAIKQAKRDKDTVGGVVEAHVFGVPIGLGSCMDFRDKLDGRLAQAVMSVQAIKGVEIGAGFAAARLRGSEVHDPIEHDAARLDTPSLGFVRPTNNAGGLEGGMTNGAPIVVRAAMKPISTLLRGLPSVDLQSRAPQRSQYERSDVCAVPACSVVVEHVVAFEVARAMVEKFAGDTLLEMERSYASFLQAARMLPLAPPSGEALA
ncbi:MAG: chorismate synthase, partial [Planctomycetota bacterium]